jgi:membrane dipeptidase
MQLIGWNDLNTQKATSLAQHAVVALEGYVTVAELAVEHRYFLLTPHQACCLGCIPRGDEACVEVLMAEPLGMTDELIRLEGRLVVDASNAGGWRFQLCDARLSALQPLRPAPSDAKEHALTSTEKRAMASLSGRRRFLTSGALLGLAACADERPTQPGRTVAVTPAEILGSFPAVDMHSHAGRVIPQRSVQDPMLADQRPFEPLAQPMRDGGLSVVCLAVVADTPVTKTVGGHIEAMRDPAPGELYAWAKMAYQRCHRLIDEQGLSVITDAVSMRAANLGQPSVVIASEGADFLEGQLERVDEFYQREDMRQLQLVHYHINELGDIQTAPRRWGGLTDFGAAVVKRCNDIGVVVDVAHGPFELVKRAVSVTSKPIILSHTSLAENPGPLARTISADHARAVASTGGVIGIWPPVTRFPDLHAVALGMARMVDVVGVDHVGLGSDMLGLTSASALPTYRDLPQLAQEMLNVGFTAPEVGKILGGNYRRVFIEVTHRIYD